MDDGSSDNTKKVIHDYFNNKSVVYKYIYQNNAGPSIARNRAIENSSGEYTAFLDSDDSWHKQKLQITYDYIKSSNAKFISSKYTFLSNDFDTLEKYDVKIYGFKDFLLSNRTSTPCAVVERGLLDKVRYFDTTLSYSEDYNLWLKIVRIEKLHFIDLPLVTLYKKAYGESGLSSHMWAMEKGELYNYKYCYKQGYIHFIQYSFFIIFSLLKYLKRILRG